MSDKAEKPQKNDVLARLLRTILDPRVLLPVLAALGIGGSSGWVMADAGGADTAKMQHIADSTTRAQLAPVVAEQKAQRNELQAQREIMEGVFGAMMDADPKLKEGVQMRAQKNQEARRKKVEDSTLLNDLTGGPQ